MGNNFIFAAMVVSATVGTILSTSPSREDAASISGGSLSAAVDRTQMDRFPGEGELMKAINSEPFRSMIQLYDARDAIYGPYGLQSANAPRFYGQHDLLQMLQESGIDVYAMSETEMEYLASMDPRVTAVLRAIREGDREMQER